MTARYVVKSGDLYADGCGCWVPRSSAYVFDKRNRAVDCAEAWRGLKLRPDARVVRLVRKRVIPVYEVTFVLRWYSQGKPTDEYSMNDGGRTMCRNQAARYLSSADARSSRERLTYYGVGGSDDICGWKVMRLLRRIS